MRLIPYRSILLYDAHFFVTTEVIPWVKYAFMRIRTV
jgi:hypothetical protein